MSNRKRIQEILKAAKGSPSVQQPVEPSIDLTLAVNRAKSLEAKAKKLEAEIAERDKQIESERKQKEQYFITNELKSLAKKLNVKESAVEDVLGLVSNKFALKDGSVFAVDANDTETDAEKYLGSWLASKEHYLAPTVAQGTGANPFPTGPLPAKQTEDIRTLQGTKEYLASKYSLKS